MEKSKKRVPGLEGRTRNLEKEEKRLKAAIEELEEKLKGAEASRDRAHLLNQSLLARKANWEAGINCPNCKESREKVAKLEAESNINKSTIAGQSEAIAEFKDREQWTKVCLDAAEVIRIRYYCNARDPDNKEVRAIRRERIS